MRIVLAISVVVIFASRVLRADLPQEKKKAPGKEPTSITGPVDKDGFIDYEAALNDRLGKGITPEKNANVLIWKALGPRPEGGRMHADYFKRMGMKEPESSGKYFIKF